MPTIYRSADQGAPPMDGSPGSVVNVLDACLVHGYGALATGLLTSNNTNVANNDTVSIGSITYTFKTTVTVANDVLIGANADASLSNLILTINLTGSPGTTFISAQTGHPEVYAATAVSGHTVTIVSKRPGTLGNAITTPTPSVGTTLSWGASALSGGSVSKAALGWTKDYSALARGIYRAPVASGGSRTYLEVIDNTPDVTNSSINAKVVGWETITSLGGGITESTGSGRFGALNGQWKKSAGVASGPTNFRTWMLLGDDRTFYVFVLNAIVSGCYYLWGFGDIKSLVTGDVSKGFVIGQSNFSPASTDYNNEYGAYASQTSVHFGHYLQRNWSGVISSPQFGKGTDASFRGVSGGMFGSLTLPHGPDGGLYMSPIYVFEGASSAWVQRGLLRGLYQPLHPITSFNDGDTFQGAGDLAGRNFMMSKFFLHGASTQDSGYFVETTAWAS